RVFLEVVAHAGDVGGDLDAAGQAHPGHLAKGRVRLLGSGRVDARAHAPALRGAPEGGSLGLGGLRLPALADQLLDGGHASPETELRGDYLENSGSARGLLGAGQEAGLVLPDRGRGLA